MFLLINVIRSSEMASILAWFSALINKAELHESVRTSNGFDEVANFRPGDSAGFFGRRFEEPVKI